MKKKLLYTITLILTGIVNSAFIYGQSSSMLDKLQGKTWMPQSYESSFPWKYTYTRTTETGTLCQPGKEDIVVERPFYLSDYVEFQFDDSKVGKVENGQYMIVKKLFRGGILTNEDGTPVNFTPTATPYAIHKLTDTELKITTTTYKALEAHTMKYVIDNTPTQSLPFNATKTLGFLDGYDIPVNNNTITDRLYTNVQLTQYTDVSAQKRGKFFRKFAPSNAGSSGYAYIVAVTFGDVTDNRTDMLCVVDNNGNILDKIEGRVTVDGMTLKQWRILSNGTIEIFQVKPSSSTSLKVEDATSFSGYIVNNAYSIKSGKFSLDKSTPSPTGTLTKTTLSNTSTNLWGYLVSSGGTISFE